MTREEAIKHLHDDWFMPLGDKLCVDGDKKGAFLEAVGMGIKALRPASRKQVEKVWRGEWNDINPAVLKHGVSWVCRCAKCGYPQDYKHNFCPNCGDAKTDEAMQIVIERLEAYHND